MKKSVLSIALAGIIFSTGSFAAGLGLSQIGTAESVATAGAAGVTNNRDASATITNAAGLSGISDNSTVIGIQYLNVGNEFERDNDDATSKGESDLFMPHLSYAQRLNEEWVVGISAHSAGGLGMEYSNGLTGGAGNKSLVDSNMIAIMNLTTSAAYQVNEQLSLGGSLIAQYATVKSEFSGLNNHEIKDDNWAPSFALSAMYQLNETTHLGMTYNYGAKHELDMDGFGIVDLNWPQMVEIGVQHQLTDDLAIMANANWQQWSRFGDDYKDTYGVGVALSYQLQDWTLQTGASIDSSPLDANNRGHALPLDQQWRVGFGGHKTLSNGMVLGLAYQYQSLGNAEITNHGLTDGYYENNRVHFITGSLSF
ncbi:aromatic hydrocarbon degradation protein [Psychromonas marina]|uniref:Aromatic hydrocarbon degradation protein n=1 Tax=Psychromonas marina TaxID=88364 RepID=A0ABQ6DZJ7_9GAMM|nr:outer membrane protein transport protein [Psychromonas marina]GLS90181.1 aromatic hydrocarbon degradation protein [Psychromonas marina]